MDQLQVTKAYGSDGLSPIFFKEGEDIIATVLQKIFTLSIDTAAFPSIWKQANIIPIHKKELTTLVNNYRPVSLLCSASKIIRTHCL